MYHKQCFRFNSSWNGHKVCFLCRARRVGPLESLYYNIDCSAKWLEEEYGFNDFLAEQMPARDPCASALPMGPGGSKQQEEYQILECQ